MCECLRFFKRFLSGSGRLIFVRGFKGFLIFGENEINLLKVDDENKNARDRKVKMNR